MRSSIKNIFAILTFSFVLFSCAKPPAAKKEKSIFVKFEAAKYGEVIEEFSTAGELKANEDVVVSAQRPGRVISINVREGQYVEAGTKLFELSGKDVDADLTKALADYNSYKKLYDEGAISKLELANYKATLDRLSSFKNDLVTRAQISGQIGEIFIDQGDYVKDGDQILELVKLYPLEITYSIPERLIPKVKLGQEVILKTDSYPGKEFKAEVKFISPKVDEQTRSTLVRASLVASKYPLKANQYVEVTQILGASTDFILVPEEAIYIDQGQEYIFTAHSIEKTEEEKKADAQKAKLPGPPPATHTAKKNKVLTGLRKPGFVQIVEGIKEDDQVVYAGLTSIYDGAKLVQVKEQG